MVVDVCLQAVLVLSGEGKKAFTWHLSAETDKSACNTRSLHGGMKHVTLNTSLSHGKLTRLSVSLVCSDDLLLGGIRHLLIPGDLHHLDARIWLVAAWQHGRLLCQGAYETAGRLIHKASLNLWNYKWMGQEGKHIKEGIPATKDAYSSTQVLCYLYFIWVFPFSASLNFPSPVVHIFACVYIKRCSCKLLYRLTPKNRKEKKLGWLSENHKKLRWCVKFVWLFFPQKLTLYYFLFLEFWKNDDKFSISIRKNIDWFNK